LKSFTRKKRVEGKRIKRFHDFLNSTVGQQ